VFYVGSKSILRQKMERFESFSRYLPIETKFRGKFSEFLRTKKKFRGKKSEKHRMFSEEKRDE